MELGTEKAPQSIVVEAKGSPLLEYSLKAKINWPGFQYHNRTVEATKSYMWHFRGRDIGMMHDIRFDDIEMSIGADRLRILEK